VFGTEVLVRFEGIETPEAGNAFRDALLEIAESDAAPLADDEFYYWQLIGLAAVTHTGDPVGTIKEVFETGANDVLVIEGPDGREHLVPFVASFVEVDLATKTATITPIPGLLD
jgi:16S rRNA processing protein RimM